MRLHLAVFLAIIGSAIAYPAQKAINVGEFYQLSFDGKTTVTGQFGSTLPSWLIYRNSILQGVPTENDIGKHTVSVVAEGKPAYNVVITVTEQTEGVCGSKATFWIEAYYDDENTPEHRVDSAIQFLEEEKGVKEKTVRIFSIEYANKTRDVEELMEEKATGNYVVIFDASCDDVDEATTILDNFVERDDIDYDNVKMTRGYYKNSKLRYAPSSATDEVTDDTEEGEDEDIEEEEEDIETTIEKLRTTTELVRTTRKINDQRPILLNSLPQYTCIRGEICELRVPAETFKDVEDGDTFKLKLSIIALDNAEVWMTTDSKGMLGVPMKTGEYSYRLEARDKHDQMASAAFSVIVKPSLPVNHKIQFEMDIPAPDVMATSPQKRIMFIKSMGRALKAPVNSFTLQEITAKNNKTVITWSNNTLPYKVCDEKELNKMVGKMIMKQKQRTKTEFVKAMGNNFYVRRASLIRAGNCEDEVEVSTTAPTIQSVQEADSQILIVCIILISLLMLTIIVIIYCVCLKQSNKKKSNATEYTTKGLPVVFPDEVEDLDPTNAGTPMLTREERPPLKVSQHENPLYKPPPPMASNSPRLGHASASSNQKLSSPFIPP